MQLTKGLFGHEFRNASHLFGLSCGQIRCDDMVHNGGWYNAAGEKLGWGDLSREDFDSIQRGLPQDEIFVVLYESDSFWKFVTHNPGLIGSACRTSADEQTPGVDFVASKAVWIITGEHIYHVSDYPGAKLGIQTHYRNNMTYEVIDRGTANALIRSTALRYGAGAETLM